MKLPRIRSMTLPMRVSYLFLLAGCGASALPSNTTHSTMRSPDVPAIAVGEIEPDELVRHIPEDAILVVHIDHAVLSESRYRAALIGDEALLLAVAVGSYLSRAPQDRLPPGLLERASDTLFVVTLDDVGLDDAFTWVEGAFVSADFDALFQQAGNVAEASGEARFLAPPVAGGVEGIAIVRPQVGVAMGPRDRREGVEAMIAGSVSHDDSVLRDLLARVGQRTAGVRVVIANTPPLAQFVRAAFAQQNLTDEIVEVFGGMSVSLDVRDGAVVSIIVHAATADGARLLGDQFDELIGALESHPAVRTLGLADIIRQREHEVIGTEARFELRVGHQRFLDILAQLSALVSSAS